MAVRDDTKTTIVDFSDKTEEMEDTTIVYFCIEGDNFLWGYEPFENADFSIVELSNVKELQKLIEEKRLSVDDLTLILKTIKLPF